MSTEDPSTAEPAAADDSAPRARKHRRTWPQRLLIVGVFITAIACFAAAGGIYAAQRVLEDRNIAPAIIDPRTNADAGFVPGEPSPDNAGDATVDDGADEPDVPPSTFPPAEPAAKNFLVTGADNNSCIDPDSPYAAAFGDRSEFGERSDTIMMWRVNPETSQAAVLSFPRDLWVTIAGRSSSQRINVAYERNNSQRLIDTIYQNFGVVADHTIQIDFCAFKTLVDAVDGVGVPFETPVRDVKTGLNVPEAGCYYFDGDHALAYVRSRSMQSFEDGEWTTDGTSDLGRISRQQDFLRRVTQSLRSAGVLSADVIGGLIETNSEYIVTDPSLTIDRMLEFAGVMSAIDPTQITTYQIEARPDVIQGNAVLVPRTGGDNMQAILSVFRGQATIAGAPDQLFDEDATEPQVVIAQGEDVTVAVIDGGDADESAQDDTTPDVPSVIVDENLYGVVPDSAIRC
ncbi:MAG: LCP family protein [Acidimicrobiia bacterium]|nr:LCP family protein [Acidimicrobiia bacterium]